MVLLCMLAVLQEKTHQTLLSGVEQFDKSTMRHTETSEKVILPNKEGRFECYLGGNMLLDHRTE